MNRLHHVALGAEHVEKLAQFYEDVLGLKRLQTHRFENGSVRSVWLDLEPGVLMIEPAERSGEDLAPMQMGNGPFLLAFRFAPEERAALRDRLSAHGISLEGRTEHTDYFRDLENNRIGVSSYPLKS